MPSQAELVRELLGQTCQCGKKKQPRNTFCRSCYYALSPQLRRDLYNRIGEGYEEAYDAAIRVLKEGA
jgi:hypothetical protein